MPRLKLTKSVIDALPTSAKEIVYWDSGCPGFGVKVTPKGRKVFIVLYRAGGAGSRLRKIHGSSCALRVQSGHRHGRSCERFYPNALTHIQSSMPVAMSDKELSAAIRACTRFNSRAWTPQTASE
jgi:Arm DNA-binding domain